MNLRLTWIAPDGSTHGIEVTGVTAQHARRYWEDGDPFVRLAAWRQTLCGLQVPFRVPLTFDDPVSCGPCMVIDAIPAVVTADRLITEKREVKP